MRPALSIRSRQTLRPLVEESLTLLRSTLPSRVELRSVLTEAPLNADVDGTQMQQVLVNLRTNVWHALQRGAGLIEVGLEAVELDDAAARCIGPLAAGPHALLWVRDDGRGVDKATRGERSEPSFTTESIKLSIGLGPAAVHGIVTAHHGAIVVDSMIDGGTTSRLYLPATDAPVPEPALVPETGLSSLPRGRGERVLYVDDDEVMLLTVERVLQRDGFNVTCCLSAKEAVERIVDPHEPIDFVLTDFDMPELSGLDVAREVGRARPDVPVVIMSGNASEDLREGARRAGVKSLLSKRNAFEELTPLIQRILAERD